MPQSEEKRKRSTAAVGFYQELDALMAETMRQQGFAKAFKLAKSLKKGRPAREMMSIEEGVAEESSPNVYDLAVHTCQGPVLFRNAERTDRPSIDPQLNPSSASPTIDITAVSPEFTAEQLLYQLADAGKNPSCSLLCTIELTRFDPSQHQVLLPLLWQYILGHRNSNNRDDLVAVGAAIRKYIAIMPMDQMGELAVLLESGHRASLPIDLEIEVAKMIYRNFEVLPSVDADPQPKLAQRLWEIVEAYIHPRILLRDKHAAATSLAIEAIVAMRSPLAEQALQAAVACPSLWFAELVSDDLDDLHERWSSCNPAAAAWLHELQNKVLSAA